MTSNVNRPVISNWFLQEKHFFIYGLLFTSSCLNGKVIYKRHSHSLRKIKELGQIQKVTIVCSINVVGLYQNIPHDEGLVFPRDILDNRVDKPVTTDTLIELAEFVLKNNILEFSERKLAQSLFHHKLYFP